MRSNDYSCIRNLEHLRRARYRNKMMLINAENRLRGRVVAMKRLLDPSRLLFAMLDKGVARLLKFFRSD